MLLVTSPSAVAVRVIVVPAFSKELDALKEKLKFEGVLLLPPPPPAAEATAAFDEAEIPLGLIAALVDKIRLGSDDGAILIFLPGWDDIAKCHDLLNELPGAAATLLLRCCHEANSLLQSPSQTEK